MTSGLRFLSQGMGDAPASDEWLSPLEAGYVGRLRFAKRRTEFRLGRWTAKKALALYLGRADAPAELASVVIDRAPDGAPAPFVDGRPAEAYLTMTDRADQAVCVVGPPGTRLGCDLELVEPRTDAFVLDFLTPAERALVLAAPEGDARALLANLVWCGKESSLKVLRTGLRRDTLTVEVSLPAGPGVDGWLPLEVRLAEGGVHHGWWQRFGAFVLTVAATEPFAPPRPLVDPPTLATAVPAESWRQGL
ncbi:MAG: 4'-phosphopantetheinyl transferase superfamily protein [Vicinamibacteria bacterium]